MLNKSLVFLGIFGLFVFTMAPAISVGDSGEFCAVSATLGVPHSPGYPAYCILGKTFTLLFPFASLAYRVNLLSAFFGALSCLLVFIFLKRRLNGTLSWAPALGGALFLAFSLCFWRTSVQSEVFTLSSFFAAACFLLLDMSCEPGKQSYFAAASLIFGIGAGNQQTIVLIFPLFLVVYFMNFKKWKPGLLRVGIVSFFCFLIGFALYAYIPVRAVKNPDVNWGNAVNFENFTRVLLRKDYGTFQLTVGDKGETGLQVYVKQTSRYFRALWEQTGSLGAILGLLGWIALIKKRRGFGIGLLLVFIFSGLFFVLISKLPFVALSEGILERFYILPMASFAISAGYALDWLNGKKKALVVFCVLLPASVFIVSKDGCNWRNYYLEYDYAKNILRTLKPGSVFFMDGGDDTFYAMQYACFAENRRRDIELHDRGGLVFKSIYGSDFRRIPKDMKEARRQEKEREYIGKRPVYYSTFNKKILPGVELRPDGILYEALVPQKRGLSLFKDSWEFYTLLRGAYSDFPDYRSRALAPVYVFMRWDNFVHDEEWSSFAMNQWRDVLWLNGNFVFSFHESGYKAFAAGDMKKAAEWFEKILIIDQNDKRAMMNLGVIKEKQNDLDGAQKLYERIISIDPGNAEAYYNIGVVYWRKGDWEKVVSSFQRVLELNPGYPNARHFLDQAVYRLNAQKR